MNRTQRGRLTLVCTVAAGLGALTAGTASVRATDGGFLSLSLCDPASQSFTTNITNTYSPFPEGAHWLYSDGAGNSTDVTVETSPSPGDTFDFPSNPRGHRAVTTIDVTETDHNADGTKEVSQNWYAQTTTGAVGTVCYFGELEVDYDASGKVIANPAPGSWRADEKGKGFAPGIVMPAHPQVGMKFLEEFAPGTAEDEGEIVGIDSRDTVNGKAYSNVVRMLEGDDLSTGKGHTDTKLFAPNVGAIRDETLLLVSFTP